MTDDKLMRDELPDLPPDGHPLLGLGATLAILLDDDDWNNIEPVLLSIWEHEKAAVRATAMECARMCNKNHAFVSYGEIRARFGLDTKEGM